MISEFNQKVVVITYAAGELGRAYSEYFLHRGARLVLHDGDQTALLALRKDLGNHENIILSSSQDMAVPDAAKIFIENVIDCCEGVDVLINNTPPHTIGALNGVSSADALSALNGHLLTTVLMTQAVLEHMRACGTGSIISTASAAGAFGAAGQAIFSAACAGVVGFIRSLSLELEATNIKVNSIAPMTASDHDNYVVAPDPLLDRSLYDPSTVAPVVAYLASEDCQLKGQFLSVTGGRVAHIFTSTVAGHFIHGEDHTQVGANLTAILATNYPLIPESAADELLMIDV